MDEVGVPQALARIGRAALVGFLPIGIAGCAEVEIGAEAVKAINESIAEANASESQQIVTAAGSPINPTLEPAPEEFEVRGLAIWDGARTLQGIWVAHPRAETARRVRIIETTSKRAVDGALFRRDDSVSGPAVLISSEAAGQLRLEPNKRAELLIVALKPSNNPVAEAEQELEEAAESGTVQPDIEVEELALARSDEIDEPIGGSVETEGPANGAAAFQTDDANNPLPEPQGGVEPAQVSEDDFADAVIQETESEAVLEAIDATLDDEGTAGTVGLSAIDLEAAGGEVLPEPKPERRDTINEELVTDASVNSDTIPNASRVDPSEPDQDGIASASASSDQEPSEEIQFNWQEASDPEVTETEQPEVSETQQLETQDAQETEPPTTTEASPAEGKLFVKAGVFGVKENADRLVAKIREAGFPAAGRSFNSGSRTLTSVVAGPFETPASQAAALETIRNLGIPDAIPSRG